MAALHIRLFGGFEARLGSGETLALKGRKTQALIAYLVLAPGQSRTRDNLVALLWSDRGEQQARSSLRQSLSELRKALSDAGDSVLIAGRDAVSFDADAIEADVTEFERLIDDGSSAALERAAELYRGDLLDGIGVRDPAFEDWLRGERRRLHERACQALSKLLDHQAGEDSERAITTARRLLALDPLREATHRTLMRLYADKGERTLALKQYQACRDVLKAELCVEPEAETRALYEIIRGEDPTAGKPDPARTQDLRSIKPLALPDKPSVAVLPFVNISGDPEQEYFADGITEDIITELTRFRSLFVIARNSSFQYKGQTPKTQDVGRDLGVQYVIEGSVRKAGNRVRVTAQLVDASSGRHVWAERYDRALEEIFAFQDELVRTIVSTVGGRIDIAGKARASHLNEVTLRAYDLYLRAAAAQDRNTKEDYQQAEQYLERAIELDPTLVQAHHHLSLVKFFMWMEHWVDDREAVFAEAFKAAKSALTLDATDGLAHAHLALLHVYGREFDKARFQIDKALQLNPNDSRVLGLYGLFLSSIGEPEQAIEQYIHAERLNPMPPGWFSRLKAIAYFMAGRYDDAISALNSIETPINDERAWLAASYAQAGWLDEAHTILEEFLRIAEKEMVVFPGRSLNAWKPFLRAAHPYKNQVDYDRLFDGLRKAGLAS